MTIEFEHKTLSAQSLVAVVSHAPGIQFQASWMSLHQLLRAQSVPITGTPFLAVFANEKLIGPGGMRWYAAAMVVPQDTTVAAPLTRIESDGGLYACHTYVGPYDAMGRVWGEFVAALAERGAKLDFGRTCREVYLNDPATTKPAECATELCILPIST